MGDDIPESYNNYLVPGPLNLHEMSRKISIERQGCLIRPMYNSEFPDRNSENEKKVGKNIERGLK